MATPATRTALGVAAVVILLVNLGVVAARTGSERPRPGGGSSARSASLGEAAFGERGAPPTEAPLAPPPAPSTSLSPTTTGAPKSTTTTTTTARTGTASTTTTLDPLGVTGPGLYAVDSDGTRARRLTTGIGMFSWSPDGSRLAFAAGEDMVIVNADGSGRTTLPAAKGAVEPAWSPDGRWIAFLRGEQGAFVAPADGSGPARRYDPDGWALAWTPDGRLAVVTAERAGRRSSVVLYDLGGDGRVVATGALQLQPAPSPDGRLIAASYQAEGINVAPVDGSGSRALTAMCCGSESVGSPLSWSPDSRLLAFIDLGDVKVVGADGTGERVFAAGATSPDWSPDGRRMAFIDERVKRPDGLLHLALQVMGADGSNRHTIFDAGDLGVVSPEWSPDGRRIAVMVLPQFVPPL